MFKIKSTKRALLASALALVVCFSMLVGTTFAWFTDSVTSGRNTIQSGNLDVELYFADSAEKVAANNWTKVTDTTDIFGYTLWEPGYTKVAYFKVVNNGSLALKYQLSADVYEEVPGKNKANQEFFLSDSIKTALVDASATRESILAMAGVPLKASFAMSAKALAAKGQAGDSEVVGLAIWMPTTVGNEANHNGTDIPSITFGINLIATQEMSETDSFGKDYDEKATYPTILDDHFLLTANTVVDDTTERYDIGLYSNEINDDGVNAKQGSVVVKKASIAEDAKTIEFVIEKLPVVDNTVELNPGEQAVTLDISVKGIKADNTEPIEITTNIGAGLGTVRLFHKDKEIPYISYNNNTGVLIFKSTSFSPFTIAYDINKQPQDTTVPQATVTNITNTIGEYDKADIGSFIGSKLGVDVVELADDQKLDALYEFKAPEFIAGNIYNDWECDFYVRYECEDVDVLPTNSIVLGGQYDEFSTSWFLFSNPEVEEGFDIPLLGAVAGSAWTYEGIANGVGTFNCGVGVVNKDDGTTLNKGEFVVMLRLTDPETGKYINVSTVTYDFATKTSTLESSTALITPVSDGQEFQDAINNGDGNIVLEGDIDLSQGIVIP